MASKYDGFWETLLPGLRRAVDAAASGRLVELDVRGVTEHGERQSWYGSALVRGDRVLTSHMAHVTALARLLAGRGVAGRHPEHTFRLVVTDGLRLQISAAGSEHAVAAQRHRSAPGRADPPRATSQTLSPEQACARLHDAVAALPRLTDPRDVDFGDGLYFLFEGGESSPHGSPGRVTRIGTHRAAGALPARLRQHYRTGPGAKNASVFRRYLGGALLRRRDPDSPCLQPAPGRGHWERQNAPTCRRCEGLEAEVTQHLREAFTFCCLPVPDQASRARLEARLIATVASCQVCRPSAGWLGHDAYASPVKISGLWNTQHIAGLTATADDLRLVENPRRSRLPREPRTKGDAMPIGLISCVKQKLDRPALARDLYISALFRGMRRAVEESCDRWFILSAKHRLLAPDTVIEPYDETLNGAPTAYKRRWSAEVLGQIDAQLGNLCGMVFEIHAGKNYYGFGLADGLQARGATVVLPAEGLTLGQRLAYYRDPDGGYVAGTSPSNSSPSRTPPPPAPGSAYRRLYDHLVSRGTDRWDATFTAIEEVLGRRLRGSARRHRPWWGNQRDAQNRPHARAWLAAGYETADVHLDSERVTFLRRSS